MKNGRKPISILALLAGMMGGPGQPGVLPQKHRGSVIRMDGRTGVAKARRAAARRRRIAARTSKRRKGAA